MRERLLLVWQEGCIPDSDCYRNLLRAILSVICFGKTFLAQSHSVFCKFGTVLERASAAASTYVAKNHCTIVTYLESYVLCLNPLSIWAPAVLSMFESTMHVVAEYCGKPMSVMLRSVSTLESGMVWYPVLHLSILELGIR